MSAISQGTLSSAEASFALGRVGSLVACVQTSHISFASGDVYTQARVWKPPPHPLGASAEERGQGTGDPNVVLAPNIII